MVKVQNTGYTEDLRRAFDELVCSLVKRLSVTEDCNTFELGRFEREREELVGRNAQLEVALLQKEEECSRWRETCREIVNGLNASITTMESILNGEKE